MVIAVRESGSSWEMLRIPGGLWLPSHANPQPLKGVILPVVTVGVLVAGAASPCCPIRPPHSALGPSYTLSWWPQTAHFISVSLSASSVLFTMAMEHLSVQGAGLHRDMLQA